MLCIINDQTDPFFNAAAEEHIFRHITQDCFMLYRNSPSIIVGKHQNTLAEINLNFVKSRNVKVVRRLSGGGTVYHDLGNLNFAFIHTGKEGKLVDFVKYTKPIIEVLNNLSVPARFEGVNDLRVGDKKISGNAEHVFKNRVLHHGTLLYSSNLEDLSSALKIRPGIYHDKAVQSIRSSVANINEFLDDTLSITHFRDILFRHILDTYEGAEAYHLTKNDLLSIQRIKEDKYATWKWNFGYSPRYRFQQDIRLGKKNLVVDLLVERGVITEISITEQETKESLDELEKELTGLDHNEDMIMDKLQSFDINRYIPGIDKSEFINGLF